MGSLVSILALALASAGSSDDGLAAKAEAAFRARNWSEAAAAYEQVVKAEPPQGQAWFRLATAQLALGQREAAASSYERAYELGTAKAISSYNLACIHALLAHKDRAFEWLDKTVDTGFAKPEQLAADSDLEALRSDPRWALALARAEVAAHPCRKGPAREFDFWLGEWSVADSAGNPVGESSIQSILDGCVLLENWTGRLGGSGKSFNLWDASHGRWQQTWVDDKGGLTEFQGQYRDGAVRFSSNSPDRDGRPRQRRLTFFDLPSGQVRQFSELTQDGGQTWVVEYDFLYTRKDAQRASPTATKPAQ